MPGRLLDRVTALFRRKPQTLREASGPVSRVRAAPRDAAREAEMDARPDTFVLTRIIGNDLVPRHAEGQSLANLRFILDHEPPLEGCEKRFVVNRILDDATRETVVAELTARGAGFTVIPFDWGDFARTGYDFAPFAPGFFQSPEFVGELDEERQRALVRTYAPKNRYLMNNNGARNAALADGRGRAKWVLPWDGNCFVTEGAWAEIRAAIAAAKGARYLIVPMARITDNALLLEAGFRPEAAEEPQVVFRADAEEAFDDRQVYGRRPKVELFCRLGVEGPWDQLAARSVGCAAAPGVARGASGGEGRLGRAALLRTGEGRDGGYGRVPQARAAARGRDHADDRPGGRAVPAEAGVRGGGAGALRSGADCGRRGEPRVAGGGGGAGGGGAGAAAVLGARQDDGGAERRSARLLASGALLVARSAQGGRVALCEEGRGAGAGHAALRGGARGVRPHAAPVAVRGHDASGDGLAGHGGGAVPGAGARGTSGRGSAIRRRG